MLDRDTQLKLQAFLDGELAEGQVGEIQDLLARDSEAQNLATELNATNGALANFEADLKLPESREFYWSKIQREIQRPVPQSDDTSLLSMLAVAWRRFLLPACATAAVILAALLAIPQHRLLPETELAVTGTDAFTYRDYAARTTLVWVSYPIRNELADTPLPDTLE